MAEDKTVVEKEQIKTNKNSAKKFGATVLLCGVVALGGYGIWKNPQILQKIEAVFANESKQEEVNPLNLLQREVASLKMQLNAIQNKQENQVDGALLEKRFENLENINQNIINSKADVAVVLGLLTRLDKAEFQLDKLNKITDKSAILLTATMMVKNSAENGGSFVYEAEILNQLAQDTPEIQQPLLVIKQASVEGVYGQAYLMQSFPEIYQQILDKYKNESEKTWKDRLNNKLGEYIKIQKKNQNTPDENFFSQLNNIEILVNSGNIKKAVLELKYLPNQNLLNNADLLGWMKKAEQKIAFDEAVSKISVFYLASLKVNFIKKEIKND